MPIKILHVIPTLGRGGAERQLVALVSHTDRSRFQHLVCHLYPGDAFAPAIREAGHAVLGLNLSGKRPWAVAARRLIGIARGFSPAVIHSWLYDANICSRLSSLRLRGIPLVTSLQCCDYEPTTIRAGNLCPLKVGALRWLDKSLAQVAHPTFVACSQFVAESYQNRLGIAPERMNVIYNSVDSATVQCEPMQRRVLRHTMGIPESSTVYLNVGRMDAQKGQGYLIRGFQRLVQSGLDVYLAIVGQGPLAPALAELAREMHVAERVRFLGCREDIGACLHMADIFVFPSLFEGLGLALIEAMMAGLPCITSRVAPLTEVVADEETGLLVSPAKSDELAEAMASLYCDPDYRRALGAQGQQEAQRRFGIRANIPEWEHLYSRIAAQTV